MEQKKYLLGKLDELSQITKTYEADRCASVIPACLAWRALWSSRNKSGRGDLMPSTHPLTSIRICGSTQ